MSIITYLFSQSYLTLWKKTETLRSLRDRVTEGHEVAAGLRNSETLRSLRDRITEGHEVAAGLNKICIEAYAAGLNFTP